MEVTELLLEPPQRPERGPYPGRVDRPCEIGELTVATNPDPEPVKPVHRRSSPSFPMRHDEPPVQPAMLLAKEARDVGGWEAAQVTAECGPQGLEEAGFRFGAQPGPQELSAGMGIVAEAAPVAVELLALAPGAHRVLDTGEQLDHYVAVPYLADELCESPDAAVEGGDAGELGGGQQLLPEGGAEVDSAQVTVEPMQAGRGGVGMPHDLRDLVSDLTEQPLELGAETLGALPPGDPSPSLGHGPSRPHVPAVLSPARRGAPAAGSTRG